MRAIEKIEAIVVSIPQEKAYLESEKTDYNQYGFRISEHNRTIYPMKHESLLVKVTDEAGIVGWGEAFGVIRAQVTKEIVEKIIGPFVIGRFATDVKVINEDLYDMMRVRGAFSGFYNDAIVGIDIAIWDLLGKQLDLPLSSLIGGCRREKIPCYISGLPQQTTEERIRFALDCRNNGFTGFKIPLVYHDNDADELDEFRQLREALGPKVDLMIDMHWKYTAHEALRKIQNFNAYNLYFAEAPVKPEDIEGQAFVTAHCGVPVALGEEFANVYPFATRFRQQCMSIVQPEMGHTGITQFLRIADMAKAFNCKVMPHATIGLGLFLTASLICVSSLNNSGYHEFQPSIFYDKLQFLKGNVKCENGHYTVPKGPGIGVEPDWEKLGKYVD